MNATFDLKSIYSVSPQTYSWDSGLPNGSSLKTVYFSSLTSTPEVAVSEWNWNNTSCNPAINPVGDGITWNDFGTLIECSSWNFVSDECLNPTPLSSIQYIGYSPYTAVTFISKLEQPTDPEVVAIKRTVDFGDYYNFDSNLITAVGAGSASFCHNYVMPGAYTITFTETHYKELFSSTSSPSNFEGCLGRHCIEWSWKALKCPGDLNVTWASTKIGGQYEKLWRFEICESIYIENSLQQRARSPLAWRWLNFLSANTFDNPNNSPITWEQTSFQGPEQLTWAETSGPCYVARGGEWTWEGLACEGPFDIKWDETECVDATSRTWNQVAEQCIEFSGSVSTLEIQKITKTALIKIRELSPVAYLSANQPIDPNQKTSPLTVQLTPRFTKSGSFPIEKIIWDLGDGSPLLVQRRWAINNEFPFVFTGALSGDFEDPRNYDVIHTYQRKSNTEFTFYPSITCYSSNTGTQDCASTVIGPLKLSQISPGNIKLIQNELTEHGNVLVAEIDRTAVAWKY